MSEQYSRMKNNINMLGQFLDHTINDVHGADSLQLIEKIREQSNELHNSNFASLEEIMQSLQKIAVEDIVTVARAFSHFLNLVNIAEQYQSTSRNNMDYVNSPRSIDATIDKLIKQKMPIKHILATINNLSIELVLTAHPTEVTRRSLVHKHIEINKCLAKLDYADLTELEIAKYQNRLLQLIAQTWHTNDIREHRPSPIEEAKWGFAVVENNLWEAVPKFLRNLEFSVHKYFDSSLAVDFAPLKMSSWMGGDRDGNPSVTAKVTQDVINLARWKAAELFFKDVKSLTMELSVSTSSAAFKQKYGDHVEPFRVVTKKVRKKLALTMEYYKALVLGLPTTLTVEDVIVTDQQLWEPLYDCYQSLCDCNMELIANGLLRDCLYRVKAFGVSLLKMDIRQDSSRHTQAMAEITSYTGLGDYSLWSEADKQAFLIKELQSKRPLIPRDWVASAQTQEVLDTFCLIAAQPETVINTYIISMAKQPSDILLVKLFLLEYGISYNLPVVPLFETLADLSNARDVMQTLFDLDWYYNTINNHVMVMIGYSDSAKDAGIMAASWAQYKAQEELIELCEQYQVELTLFHGRGGTIGRGGAPAHEALLSQPPKSLKNGLRVTEQGEMIRFKLGFPEVAVESFDLYASAILEANLLPPPTPKEQWRNTMEILSQYSYQAYNDVVRHNPNFIEYFKLVTPSEELSKLPLGSRPAKRFNSSGIEGLRAIPWIFAWTQNRLLLPTWLGAGESIQKAINSSAAHKNVIDDMCANWPFFITRISLLEMIYSKVSLWISKEYEEKLASADLKPLGKELRDKFRDDVQTVLSLNVNKTLMADLPWIAESIAQRNIYTDPLNLLQIELLSRIRNNHDPIIHAKLEKALMIVITGIAAGMRNTG